MIFDDNSKIIFVKSNEHPQQVFMKKEAKLSLNYHQISSNTHLISSAGSSISLVSMSKISGLSSLCGLYLTCLAYFSYM